MRRSAAEKMEIIRLVEGTDLPVRATLRQLGIPRSTFYGWYQRYLEGGLDGLKDKQPVRTAGSTTPLHRAPRGALEARISPGLVAPRKPARGAPSGPRAPFSGPSSPMSGP